MIARGGVFKSRGAEAIYRAQLNAEKAGWFNTVFISLAGIVLALALRHNDWAATTWRSTLTAPFSPDLWMGHWRMILLCASAWLSRAACCRATSCTAVVVIVALFEAAMKALLMFTPAMADCLEPLRAFLIHEGRLHEAMATVSTGCLSHLPAAVTTAYHGTVFFLGTPLTGRQQVPAVLLRDLLHLALLLGSKHQPPGCLWLFLPVFLSGVAFKIVLFRSVDIRRRNTFLSAIERARKTPCYERADIEDEEPSCRSPQPRRGETEACRASGSGSGARGGSTVAYRLSAPAEHLLLPASIQSPAVALPTVAQEVKDTRMHKRCRPLAVQSQLSKPATILSPPIAMQPSGPVASVRSLISLQPSAPATALCPPAELQLSGPVASVRSLISLQPSAPATAICPPAEPQLSGPVASVRSLISLQPSAPATALCPPAEPQLSGPVASVRSLISLQPSAPATALCPPAEPQLSGPVASVRSLTSLQPSAPATALCPPAEPRLSGLAVELSDALRIKTYLPYRTNLERLSVVFLGQCLLPASVWRARLPALLRMLNSRYPAYIHPWALSRLSVRTDPFSNSVNPSIIAELSFIRTAMVTRPNQGLSASVPLRDVAGTAAAAGAAPDSDTLKALRLEDWLNCLHVDQTAAPAETPMEDATVKVQVGDQIGVFIFNSAAQLWAPAVALARATPRNVATLPSLRPRCLALPQRIVRFRASIEAPAMLSWIECNNGALRVEVVLHKKRLPVHRSRAEPTPHSPPIDVYVDLSNAEPGLLSINVWSGDRLLASDPVLLLREGCRDAAAELGGLPRGALLVRKLAGLIAVSTSPATARKAAGGRRLLLPAVIAAAALLAAEPELSGCNGTQALIRTCVGKLESWQAEAAAAAARTGQHQDSELQ